jgi:hypothetical protein
VDKETLLNIVEGNPSALTVASQLLRESRGESYLFLLKRDKITGWKLWVCYKDICKSDIDELKKRLTDGTLLDSLKQTPDWKYHESTRD